MRDRGRHHGQPAERANKPAKRLPSPFSRKRFGQHFLEPAWVAKVIAAIAPAPDETVLEIGPGRGALTILLAARARAVIACELDRDLIARLRDTVPPNVTIVEGDFLDIDAGRLRAAITAAGPAGPLRVAGNLPYNVGSPILFHLADLFAAGLPFVDATLMLQREVADRLTAAPGSRDYSPLTILTGRHATAERLLALPPGAFRPPPKVHSALLRLTFHPPNPPALDEDLFARLVRAIFSRRRKTIANALGAFPPAQTIGAAEALRRAGIDAGRRPETLAPDDLVRLADVFASGIGRAVL